MKIAILIYGRLNKSLERYNDIINSLSNYDSVDFFVLLIIQIMTLYVNLLITINQYII